MENLARLKEQAEREADRIREEARHAAELEKVKQAAAAAQFAQQQSPYGAYPQNPYGAPFMPPQQDPRSRDARLEELDRQLRRREEEWRKERERQEEEERKRNQRLKDEEWERERQRREDEYRRENIRREEERLNQLREQAQRMTANVYPNAMYPQPNQGMMQPVVQPPVYGQPMYGQPMQPQQPQQPQVIVVQTDGQQRREPYPYPAYPYNPPREYVDDRDYVRTSPREGRTKSSSSKDNDRSGDDEGHPWAGNHNKRN